MKSLFYAGRALAADMASTFFFMALLALTHNVMLAIALGMALGVAQVLWHLYRREPIDAMQWLSLFLVVVFGGATLLTRDPVFIMLKPTLVYCAVGIVMLRPGWMSRYVSPLGLTHGADVTIRFGYLWAALMFTTAAANLAIATLTTPTVWAWFVAVVPGASKLILVLVQYGVTRGIVRRRLRAARELPVAARQSA